ncbi:MAG: hypothetical protein AB1403_26530, partial [Candidatus Riflebacteria bacterium]
MSDKPPSKSICKLNENQQTPNTTFHRPLATKEAGDMESLCLILSAKAIVHQQLTTQNSLLTTVISYFTTDTQYFMTDTIHFTTVTLRFTAVTAFRTTVRAF